MKLGILLLLCLVLLCGCFPVALAPTVPPTSVPAPTFPTDPTLTTQAATAPTQMQTQPTDPPETQPPQPQSFLLSFAGDCTFGNQIGTESDSHRFLKLVGDRYDYPFSNVKPFFENDDFTFVNLEGALTAYNPKPDEIKQLELDTKSYRFRGPMEYARILTAGSVEFASVANNHVRDYGMQGWRDTMLALENEGVNYASYDITCLAETESGLKIGIISAAFSLNEQKLRTNVADLRSRGAEIIVLSIHWGTERDYAINDKQLSWGHMAIDCGVDIVHGHHTHTLQPIERYGSGIIFYSTGNFSFGGNSNPKDKDTAVLQLQVIRRTDGSIDLGELTIIPCRVSSVTDRNDYCPTPYDPSDPGYERVLSKLNGTFSKN